MRDPRKKRLPAIRPEQEPKGDLQPQENLNTRLRPLPFEPNQQLQQSVGSGLGSYMLMGAGMALGFTLIGALFG